VKRNRQTPRKPDRQPADRPIRRRRQRGVDVDAYYRAEQDTEPYRDRGLEAA
jgi:hypothetical protein